ncbi:hypothetical protein SCLCIDRAFT_34175 [Scleroderma citrinum Foug A]|uniref:RanBD1 domain-containing protein n=1 Tax=Scleroderma citrinum Foug A TaxID=1036808 RepID=A0A0C3D357_9AGAM|nr:hypothetical protein SCLCIDRAFT_34200 [Scleroderma citrinum Foug A]KIM50551.1 hypothetical protein SCLCIDRAFT_34175 [Scleroderma citrinum Foug A]
MHTGTDSPKSRLKRNLADRGTSQGPESPYSSRAETKRPRDDGDKDDNTRVSKRLSPPPEQRRTPLHLVKRPLKICFGAYASVPSPFASIKGQNVFVGASNSNQIKKSPTPEPTPLSGIPGSSTLSQSPFSLPTFATRSQQPSLQQTPQNTTTKRTGFEVFAGSSSPFASPFTHARPKSPLGSNSKSALACSKCPPRRAIQGMNAAVFAMYAGCVTQMLSVSRPQHARADSPSGGSSRSSLESKQSPTLDQLRSNENNGGEEEGGEREENEPTTSLTFSEKLRSAKDLEDDRSEEEKEKLIEQEVLTGEEDEETIHQVRGKLYVLCPQNQWKERGTGQLRLECSQFRQWWYPSSDEERSRFHCHTERDAVPGAIEGGTTIYYNLRAANAKIAQELLEEISANIPPC